MTVELTVGIPVYNEPYSIYRSVSSVLNQSWSGSYELLVVDDGSTDSTAEIVLELASRYPQIRLIQHNENKGRPEARSTLAANARGEWFAMLDADDEWYPNKLERQFALIRTAKSDGRDLSRLMVCGNIHHVDVDKGTERIKDFYTGYGVSGYGLERVLKGDNTPISQLAILPTTFMKQIGPFDPALRRAQDWDFLIRFFRMGGQIEFVPSPPLAIFNFRRAGRNAELVRSCMMAVIDKHLDAYQAVGVDPREVRTSIQAYIDSFSEVESA